MSGKPIAKGVLPGAGAAKKLAARVATAAAAPVADADAIAVAAPAAVADAVAPMPIKMKNSTLKSPPPEILAAFKAKAEAPSSTMTIVPMPSMDTGVTGIGAVGAAGAAGAAGAGAAGAGAAGAGALFIPRAASAVPKVASVVPKVASVVPKATAAAGAGAGAVVPSKFVRPVLRPAPPVPVRIAGEFVERPNAMAALTADEDDERAVYYRERDLLTKYTPDKYPVHKGYQDRQDIEETQGKYLTNIDAYIPSTRKGFYQFIQDNYASLFSARLEPLGREIDPKACEKLLQGGPARVEPFLYQRFVKEYTRMASPYRGLLVYHGLGSGKTCSAIAASEAIYGISNRRIIVMTPKSLRGNFINELKFCGFRHFSVNNFWTKLPLVLEITKESPAGKISLMNELFARSVMGLSMNHIMRLRSAFEASGYNKKNIPYIWIPDFDKESNWAKMTKEDQTLIQEQISEIINNRIEFINYNGVTAATLKRWACEERGHFDNAVIVVDEIHNLVRLMQETIEPFLFRRGKRARKIEIEPVTPQRWDPKLCGTPLNYKRGFLFYRLLCDARNSKIIGLSGTPIVNFPEELGILTNILTGYIDCFRIRIQTSEPAKVSQAIALIRKELRVDVVRPTQGEGTTLLLASVFTEGYVKVPKTTASEAGAKPSADPEIEGVKLDLTPDGPGQEPIEAVAARATATLNAAGIKAALLPYQSFSRLPPDADTFRSTFVSSSDFGLEKSRADVLRKRLTGVISYYKGSKADFVPQVTKDEVVFCDMSPYVFKEYCVQRSEEISRETKETSDDKVASLYAAVEMNAKAKNPSSYKFRSRAVCNFAFPESIPRPYPSDKEKEAVIEAETKPVEEDAVIGEDETVVEYAADEAAEAVVEEEERAIDAALELGEEVTAAGAGAAGAGASTSKRLTGGGNGDDDASSSSSTIDTVVAAVGAVVGAQAFVTKPYDERLQETMAKLNANRNQFLKLDSPIEASSLHTYSPKLERILRKLTESPGPNLVYSQFKTVEGLGVLGIALRANGYEEIKLEGPDDSPRLSGESIASIGKGPSIKRFISFSGDGSRDHKLRTLQIFNGRLTELPPAMQAAFIAGGFDLGAKYLHGEICKVIGITGAGAEGISLRNVRQVHIMEPYWNMVRIEQVKGRAVRICSHMDLPMDERKVEIYTYVARFSDEQVVAAGDAGIPNAIRMKDAENIVDPTTGRKITHIYTSDEGVYNVSLRKEQIIQSLLKLMKEVSVDCQMNAPDNEPDLECFVTAAPKPGGETKMFDPDLQTDIAETATVRRPMVAATAAAPGVADASAVAAAGAGAGAAAAASSTVARPKTEREEFVKILTVAKRSTGEKVNYIVGKIDMDGYAPLYDTTDPTLARPLAKVQVLAEGYGRIIPM